MSWSMGLRHFSDGMKGSPPRAECGATARLRAHAHGFAWACCALGRYALSEASAFPRKGRGHGRLPIVFSYLVSSIARGVTAGPVEEASRPPSRAQIARIPSGRWPTSNRENRRPDLLPGTPSLNRLGSRGRSGPAFSRPFAFVGRHYNATPITPPASQARFGPGSEPPSPPVK